MENTRIPIELDNQTISSIINYNVTGFLDFKKSLEGIPLESVKICFVIATDIEHEIFKLNSNLISSDFESIKEEISHGLRNLITLIKQLQENPYKTSFETKGKKFINENYRMYNKLLRRLNVSVKRDHNNLHYAGFQHDGHDHVGNLVNETEEEVALHLIQMKRSSESSKIAFWAVQE